MIHSRLPIACAFLIGILGNAALAEDGVSDNKIEFGQVNRSTTATSRKKTVSATKKIIEEDKVFAIIGAVGTLTSKAG